MIHKIGTHITKDGFIYEIVDIHHLTDSYFCICLKSGPEPSEQYKAFFCASHTCPEYYDKEKHWDAFDIIAFDPEPSVVTEMTVELMDAIKSCKDAKI